MRTIWSCPRTFRTQVHSCQAIVQFAIDSAQLIILVRSENASKNAQYETEKQLRNLEIAIQEHIELTKRDHDEALQRQKEIESPEDEDEDEDEDGGAQRTLAIQEIEKQSRLLEADQNASGVVSQILSNLLVPEAGSNYNIDFSGSRNWGVQIGHSAGTVNWNGSRT
ncbi:Cytochrome P450 [Penicillium canescens]|nr:Cytochrome P450 [Penicillium canescens]